MEFRRGVQVIKRPTEISDEDFEDPDIEYGFVTSIGQNGTVFCRYWSKPDPRFLRTKSNSEGTDAHNLKPHPYKPQKIVDDLLETMP